MILPGETEAGTAGTQPCRGIVRWAHRDDERGREDSFLRRPTSIGSKDPHALKIPARRAEYSLTENVASPFQAEPRHDHSGLVSGALTPEENLVVCKRYPLRVRTLYFFAWSPTSFTVIARQPVFGFAFG